MHPPKLGIFLPIFEGSDDFIFRHTLHWQEALALAKRAEMADLDSVWLPDHLLWGAREQGLWDAWSILAALAAATERVELGTLVACTAFRNPGLLAKSAETIDEISNGRLILGLGAGYYEPEFRAFGYPFDHRVTRFEEALIIITRLLRDGFADFEGTYASVRNCELRPRGPRAGALPIMVGGGVPPGPRMVRLGVKHADIWNNWLAFGRSYPDALPPLRDQADAACAAVGRDPATLQRTVTIMVVSPGHDPIPTEPSVQPVAGSAEEIAEVLRDFAELGISHLQMVLNPCTEAAVEALAPVAELVKRG